VFVTNRGSRQESAGPAVVVIVGAVVLIVNLTRSSDSAGRVTVKIGTTEASADYWPILIKLAAAQGIDIQTVNFGDYTQANPALSQGQLDLNLFQHLLYLASFNVSTNDTLTPIGSTVVVPLGVYSQKHTSLDQIPQGGQVTIPNDPTNQARALLVLQQAGLIKLNLAFNHLPSAVLRGRVRFGAFSDEVVLGGAGVFRSCWAAGAGSAGFRCAGREWHRRADARKPSANPGRGQPVRRGGPFPGSAEVLGQVPGQAELGETATIIQVQRSAAWGVRIFGAVQPNVCLNSRKVCSMSKRRRNICQSRSTSIGAGPVSDHHNHNGLGCRSPGR